MSFGIQQKCIESLINYNAETTQDYARQVCAKFDYIWRNDRIESKYRTAHNEDLFTASHDMRPFVNDFYLSFWRRAPHDNLGRRQVSSNTFKETLVSVLFQYRRLYFWWRNEGDDRRKFKAIINTFEAIQKEVVDRTQDINDNQIMYGINSILNYPNHIAVFDHLVYYLVKAFCSRILSTTRRISQMFARITTATLDYTPPELTHLSKPGWVPLFRTMYSTFRKLNAIRTEFVVYEDENERLFYALDKTKVLIKDIYRQFYKKLLVEWINELYVLLNNNYPAITQLGRNVVVLHTISGISFLSAFIDDFRFSGQEYRKIIIRIMRKTPDATSPQQHALPVLSVGIRDYLRDKTAHRCGTTILIRCMATKFHKNLSSFRCGHT